MEGQGDDQMGVGLGEDSKFGGEGVGCNGGVVTIIELHW